MTMTPELVLSIYLMVGVGFYFWSEPYRPQSRAAFDACFQANRLVWIVMVLIASMLWPVLLLRMSYRFFFAGRKEDKNADR